MSPGVRLCVRRQHSQFWPNPTCFVDYYSSFWGPRSDFHSCLNPKVCLQVGHQHSQFWPILAHFMDYYSLVWGHGVITTINKPWDASMCRSSTLAVFADPGPFHGLLLIVLHPGAISTINEPQGAFTCRPSTLVVLANSGPFRGLLLIVLGPQSDFYGC